MATSPLHGSSKTECKKSYEIKVRTEFESYDDKIITELKQYFTRLATVYTPMCHSLTLVLRSSNMLTLLFLQCRTHLL
jgi:hypothetical protein